MIVRFAKRLRRSYPLRNTTMSSRMIVRFAKGDYVGNTPTGCYSTDYYTNWHRIRSVPVIFHDFPVR